MTVSVLLFAHYRDIARELSPDGILKMQVEENATVADVARLLAAREPRLNDLAQRTRVAVAGEMATLETMVHAGDEIAFLPPMSGG